MRFGPDDYADRSDTYLRVVARLRPGVSLAQARSDLTVVASQLERAYPKENAKTGATVVTLRDEVPQQGRTLLIALSAASAGVLLIAVTNLASLLLTRALSRQREMSVRSAIGAGRRRLVRQMLTESLVVALAGGALGVLLATFAVPVIAKLVPNALPVASSPTLDLRMLGVALFVTIATGLAFGLVPALRVSGTAGTGGLREGDRAGISRHTERLKSLLVVAEVASTVVLLVASGLLIRALWQVQSTDPGFRPDGVLAMRTTLPLPKYAPTARRVQFYRDVLAGVKALPGVSGAAYISFLPMVMGGGIWPVIMTPGQDPADSQAASLRFVTPGFFAAAGIPIRMGRDISDADTAAAPAVAIVSESFVRQVLEGPGSDRPPVHVRPPGAHGRRRGRRHPRPRSRARQRAPGLPPYQQVPDNSLVFYIPKDLIVRATTGTGTLVPAIRRIVATADAQLPVSDIRTLSDIVALDTSARVVQVRVLAGFALLAFVLAGIGIHGLLAFGVSQRMRELAVRVALGASRGDVLRLVIGQGLIFGGCGILIGLPLAYAAARSLQTLLAGVQPADTPTFGAAIGTALVMTLAGSLLPARRALAVDPASAMRSE